VGGIFASVSLLMIDSPITRVMLVGIFAFAALLIAVDILVFRAALQLPGGLPRTAEERAIGRRVALVFWAEAITIMIVSWICSGTHRPALITPLVLIIVGVHFMPLAWIFKVPRYYITGLCFCGIPALTLLLIREGAQIGHASAWFVVPSLGCSLVALLTGMAGVREAWQSVRDSRSGIPSE
jgi:hypothetical protein